MQRILAIDDDATILMLLERCLGGLGYDIETVSDPAGAMGRLSEGGYALVIIDIVLPETDGFAVFKEVCAEFGLPCLFLTVAINSFSTTNDVARELWETEFPKGKTDILYKPFPLRLLADKVEGLIGAPDLTGADGAAVG